MSGITREEFYSKIDEWISKPKEAWNHLTMVAYFYKKYHLANDTHFIPARWSGNPASSKECKDIKKVFDNFVSDNYIDLDKPEKIEERVRVYVKIYNYINWLFDFKYRHTDRSVITTQFMLQPYNLNAFNIAYKTAMSKQQSKDKISVFKDWCKSENPNILERFQIESKDDLILISRYIKTYELGNDSAEHKAVSYAKEIGLI
jgi:hypothetical protein